MFGGEGLCRPVHWGRRVRQRVTLCGPIMYSALPLSAGGDWTYSVLASGLEVGQRPGAERALVDLCWAGGAQLKERSVEWQPLVPGERTVCQSSL